MYMTDRERRLIELIRETRFGRIENFRLAGGIPVVDDNTNVCTEYKLSGVDSKEVLISDDDYVKRLQVRTMLDRFRMIGDGIVECLDVRDGLPFKMTVKKSALI